MDDLSKWVPKAALLISKERDHCFVDKQRDLGQALTLKLRKTACSEQVSFHSPETMI